MSETLTEAHFEGAPDTLRAWLGTLGWDEAEGIASPPSGAVAAFGPFGVRSVLGADVGFIVLMLSGEVTPPDGVYSSEVASAAVGVFMPGPKKPTPRQWLDAALSLERQAEVYLAAQGTPLAFVLWRLSAAQEVDVGLPETIAGVGALAGAGLITADEQQALLA